MFRTLASAIQWFLSRVLVIYIILFIFIISFVDLKAFDMRIKIRRLNNAIPDFSDMIIFSKDPKAKIEVDWKSYQRYFEIIMKYMPDDLVSRQLLGYADYYSGQEQKAIDLLQTSSVLNGQNLFWPNYNLGIIYYKRGMWPQAAQCFLKVVSSSPKLTLFLMENSIVYKQIFASPYFKYSISDEIKDAQSEANILLLSCLYSMRQYDKVILLSNLAITNDLSYKDAFYNYAGLSYFAAGQYQKAFVLFQKSLTIEKNDPETYYYISGIFQKAGQLEQARAFLQISYTLHQKNDPRFPYESQDSLRFF